MKLIQAWDDRFENHHRIEDEDGKVFARFRFAGSVASLNRPTLMLEFLSVHEGQIIRTKIGFNTSSIIAFEESFSSLWDLWKPARANKDIAQ